MENTRLGKSEAIALIVTIMTNHVILTLTKTIISGTYSSAILHVIYISLVALALSYIICKLLNKFPTFDILDISNFLGGKLLKFIVGILFFAYFIFFAATLLKNFATCLQISYYPSTNVFYIIIVFLIAAIFVCSLKHNALFRSNLLTLPLVTLSICLLFVSNIGNYTYQNIFPLLGNGINANFLSGLSNLFAFQGLLHILFLPPRLKDVTKLKSITLLSILFSGLYLTISVATVLLLFGNNVSTSLLMPLYSAVRFIEFGSFFQRLDSIFILTWIISFTCYLCIIVNTCSNILSKITFIKANKYYPTFICLLILTCCLLSKNYGTSTYLSDVVYKYCFFAIISVSFIILCLAYIFKYIKSKKQNNQTNSSILNGGVTNGL